MRHSRAFEASGYGQDHFLLGALRRLRGVLGKGDIAGRLERQMQIRPFTRRRSPRINHQNTHRRPRMLCRHRVLKKNLVAPDRISAYQRDKMRLLHIRIDPRNNILAKGAKISRYGDCHT